MCRNPYVNSSGKAYGCGQCTPCRINRIRKWQTRMMLEARQYTDNVFLTLTYDDASLVRTESGEATLSPDDLRLFLYRLRWHYAQVDRRFRFYAVGEYGDEKQRPHYHLALFNLPNCAFGMSVYSKLRTVCCPVCENYRRIWGKGHIFCGTMEKDSAGYVAGYIAKKMTKADDPRLGGRYPEFARMSRMPGIGAGAMWEVADVLMQYNLDARMVDVPSELQEGRGSMMPLDRYLRQKLRTMIGRDEKAPQEVLDQMAEEMQALYERAVLPVSPSRTKFNKEVMRGLILDEYEAKYQRWMARRKMFNKRRGTL